MILAVVVTLLVFWIAIGVALALLIGRTARVADDRQQDAMLLGARTAPTRPAARTAPRAVERTPARV